MVFVMPVPAVQYIKKEDVPEFLNKRRLFVPIVLLLTTFLFVMMVVFIYPRLINVYNDFNTAKPLPLTLFPYIFTAVSAVNVCLSAYFILNKPDSISIQNRLNKYKPGEMINIVKEFSDYRLQWFVFLLVGISIALLVCSLIVPIYSLTNSIN